VNVRDDRTRAGLTQKALARRAGLSQPNVSAYESGTRRPSAATADRLRRALGPRPSERLGQYRAEVAAALGRHGGRAARIFGSAARGDDTINSDIDLLVDFAPGATLLDLGALTEELTDLLGVPVDVVSAGGLRGHIGHRIAAEAVPLVA
jgi:predicted nucleotidyltransferase